MEEIHTKNTYRLHPRISINSKNFVMSRTLHIDDSQIDKSFNIRSQAVFAIYETDFLVTISERRVAIQLRQAFHGTCF